MDTSEVTEIVGQEEENAEVIESETTEIVSEEGARVAEMEEEEVGQEEDEEIGFSFKKFRKRVGRFPKKLKVAAAVVAPLPAFQLLAMARRKPAYRAKVEAVKKAAETSPVAAEAYENLQAASEVQRQAYEDTGEWDAYDPYAEPWMEEESVEGEPSLYEWGAMAGSHDVIGFSFKKAFRKLGRVVDPTKASSPFRSALQSIPGVGPQLTAAADMLAKARAGDKASKQKVADVKALADAGDPKGKEALANLQAANVLSPKTKLLGIFSRYEYGARVAV